MKSLIKKIVTFVTIFVAISCKDGTSMIKLETQKYFTEPKIAKFVDNVQQGKVALVNEGLRSGIDPNVTGIDGFRPIHFVFFAKDTGTLKVLLAAGADPNARLKNGNTPLHFAARMPDPDFCRILLAAGANPNAQGENEKPVIHEALTSHQPEVLKLLVGAGANINVVWGGTTPMLAAMKMFLWDMASTLVSLNADIAFRDNTGKNATERFCFQISKVPSTPENNKGITALMNAFKRRGIVPQCEAQLSKFH
jgi:ankyrin repeat protein